MCLGKLQMDPYYVLIIKANKRLHFILLIARVACCFVVWYLKGKTKLNRPIQMNKYSASVLRPKTKFL